MIPVIQSLKPLSNHDVKHILTNDTTNKDDVLLVVQALKKLCDTSLKFNISPDRLYPIVDFKFKTTSIWYD